MASHHTNHMYLLCWAINDTKLRAERIDSSLGDVANEPSLGIELNFPSLRPASLTSSEPFDTAVLFWHVHVLTTRRCDLNDGSQAPRRIGATPITGLPLGPADVPGDPRRLTCPSGYYTCMLEFERRKPPGSLLNANNR